MDIIDRKAKARTFCIKVFYRHLKNMMESFVDLIRARKSGNVSKAFTEKIMLAVTEVNGCRYCNFLHTKIAINAGVSEEEIQSLLNKQFKNLSPDETHALMFAQHYADTGGQPDTETYQKFKQTYGEEKARGILAIIKTIMVGNIYGISVEALINRFKRNSSPDSKLKDEIFIIVGIVPLVPIICIQLFLARFSKHL